MAQAITFRAFGAGDTEFPHNLGGDRVGLVQTSLKKQVIR
jgi:hypothetical protein